GCILRSVTTMSTPPALTISSAAAPEVFDGIEGEAPKGAEAAPYAGALGAALALMAEEDGQ
ncbi:MAG: hypothetical protein IJ983_01295, partial [Kiritimatiellae bacterium]|nr:hypothetical protein [Kiritimatiellia bacterium]